MNKNYCFLSMLLCMSLVPAATQSQDKLWILPEGGTAIGYMNTDGSDVTWATTFMVYRDGSWTSHGYNPIYAIQASNGEIFTVTNGGGVDDFGTIVKISSDGIHKVRDLGYAQAEGLRLTEGKDGFIYGVSPSAFNYYIFRFRSDGSDYQRAYITGYGFHASDLLTTKTGDVLGTTKFHLYKMKPDMSGIENLYEYTRPTGNVPTGELIQGSDGFVYGVTRHGGALNYGVVYKIRPDGTGHQVLAEFNNQNGRYPDRGLTLDQSGNLFGVTLQGGKYKKGVIFTLKTDGTGFRVLHHFQSNEDHTYAATNNVLQLGSDGTLYGLTPGSDDRRIFRFNPGNASFAEFGNLGNRYSMVKFFTSVQPVVTLLEPKNNATNVVVNPELRVTLTPGAGFYWVELSKTPDFSGEVIVSTNTHNEINFRLTELLQYNTKYYARVKTSLWPSYGPTTSFTTRSPEAFAFITKPVDGSVDNPAPTLKVTANAVTGAKRYTIELSTAPDFDGELLSKTSSIDNQRTLTFEGLAFATKYFARMRTDISAYGRITSFTTKAEPFVMVIDPSHGTSGVDPMAFMLETSTIDGARRYIVQLSPDASFNESLSVFTSFEDHQHAFVVQNLEHATMYYARAKSDISTQFGPITSFTTQAAESLMLWGVTNTSASGQGTIFSFSIDDGTFTKYYEFQGPSPEEKLQASLVPAPGGKFYGTTGSYTSSQSKGTFFSFDASDGSVDLSPALDLHRAAITLGSDNHLYAALDNFPTTDDTTVPPGYLLKYNKQVEEGQVLRHFAPWQQGHNAESRLLEMPDQYLYGTATGGGFNNMGVIYRIRPDGSDYSVLFEFNNSGGALGPNTGLINGGDGFFYATTRRGGSDDSGTIYRIRYDGSEFTLLHQFSRLLNGNAPEGDLLMIGNVLYGTTIVGGASNRGTIFGINKDGSGFETLHHFSGPDGHAPVGSLATDKNGRLYGMTRIGGIDNRGVLFRIETDGDNFIPLVFFNGQTGGNPDGSLVVRGGIRQSAGTMVRSERHELIIDVHPNPTPDNFIITNSSTSTRAMQVSITSLEGLDMGSYVLSPNEPLHIGGEFPKGIYLLKVMDGDDVTVKRILKK